MRNLKLKGLKYNKGKYELYGDRFVFFPPQVIDILASIYGEGVKSLLVWLGKKAGWKLAQTWEENLKPKSLEGLVDDFIEIMNNQGWGNFVAKEVSDKEIRIEQYHNISSELDNKAKYGCYFVTGILTGFGEFALYRVNVTETMCIIDNPEASYCEYKIEKTA